MDSLAPVRRDVPSENQALNATVLFPSTASCYMFISLLVCILRTAIGHWQRLLAQKIVLSWKLTISIFSSSGAGHQPFEVIRLNLNNRPFDTSMKLCIFVPLIWYTHAGSCMSSLAWTRLPQARAMRQTHTSMTCTSCHYLRLKEAKRCGYCGREWWDCGDPRSAAIAT